MQDSIIKIENLSYNYSKKKKVLNNINLNIPKGSIYGFLGPNGAGKSTTMQLITNLLPIQEGEISYFNTPLQEQVPNVFYKIGSLIESPSLYLHLSGIDNLKCVTTLKNISKDKISEVLELVGLSKNGKQRVKEYSLGMKQRLAIAMTLIGEPEILLLDEPVNGLDPTGITEIRELLVKLNKEQGITIFISSHLLSEIEKMCSHIGIINNGELKFEGTIKELAEKSGKCKIQTTTSQLETHKEILVEKYPSIEFLENNQFSVVLENKKNIPDFSKFLIHNNIDLFELKIIDGLEEWFLSLTSKN